MKTILTGFLCFLLLLLAGCQNPLSPEQRQAAVNSLDLQYQTGAITKTERDAAVEQLNKPAFNLNDLFPWVSMALAALGVPVVIGTARRANQTQVEVDELWEKTHAAPTVSAKPS